MELASQEQILRLTNSLERGSSRNSGRPRKEAAPRQRTPRAARRLPLEDAAASHSIKGQHGCKCGHCRVCLQNAEWDARFNEKFGQSMKDYYSGMRLTRQASWWSDI